MELRLPERDDDDFAKRFNYVGKLYSRCMADQDNKQKWDDYFEVKYALEQGLPISIINDI